MLFHQRLCSDSRSFTRNACCVKSAFSSWGSWMRSAFIVQFIYFLRGISMNWTCSTHREMACAHRDAFVGLLNGRWAIHHLPEFVVFACVCSPLTGIVMHSRQRFAFSLDFRGNLERGQSMFCSHGSWMLAACWGCSENCLPIARNSRLMARTWKGPDDIFFPYQ